MDGQLHITHRGEYLRGYYAGKRDATASADYRPRDGADWGAVRQRAYGLGYESGYAEGNPCDKGTCGHRAHAR